MSSGVAHLGAMLKKANQTRMPEDSIVLRVAVLAAVVTGALAVIAQGAVSITTSLAVIVVLPVAYGVSYLRRNKDNYAIKLAVTVGACIALFRFLEQVRAIATLDEVRFPLADLFLWVQVLHGFDLPARKDLNFSLGASLTLMAVAGSLSQDMRFGAFGLVYFVLVAYAMVLAHRSELAEGTEGRTKPQPHRPTRRNVLWDVGKGAAAALVGGAMLFLLIPQPSSVRSFSLPFSLGGGIGVPANGGIANPGFPDGASARSAGPAYYGFNDRLDLRVRGDLSDDLVMRVRASSPALWRGMVFGTYDGVAWEGDTSEMQDEDWRDAAPFYYPPTFRSLGPRAAVQQTFYVEAEQPSALFAAGQPETVWYDGAVAVDDLGGLRTASTLSEGTVYSVVSSRGAASEAQLRSISPEVPPEPVKRYLQLPSSVPERVRGLAREITAGTSNDYDRVKAIESYLAGNFEYSLDSPVPEAGRDAVDHFLFEAEVGFCEQFASATAVMLRSLGIPARVVAGYTPGSHNPFTGYYEVRSSDAHAWVEVWFPQVGWYEFDPTFAVPPAKRQLSSSMPLARAVEAIVSNIKTGIPGGLKAAVLSLVGIGTVGALAWMVWRRRRRTAVVPGRRSDAFLERPPGPVTLAFRKLEASLAAKGVARRPPETAAEVMWRAADTRQAHADAALCAFERERYAERPPSKEEVDLAVEELARLSRDQCRNSRRGWTEG